jgi:PPOX class probable FMN-dependent enzyme
MTGPINTAASPPAPLERDVVANGLRLHYLEWSQPGRDIVVWLHGGGLHAHTWDTVIPGLNGDYHSYAVDLRGHGDSEWSPTLDYTLDSNVRDLDAFVEQLGIDRFFLIGHSLGAFVAIRYAASHSQRLAGLVVVDATPFVEDGAAVDRVRRFALEQTEFGSLDDALAYAARFKPGRDPRALRASLEQSLRRQPDGTWSWKHDRRRVDHAYFEARIAEAHSLRKHCRDILCPLLVIRGSDGCPAEEASRFAALVADSRLLTVKHSGHNVHRDNPTEFVNAVRWFLDEHRSLPPDDDSHSLGSEEALRAVYRPPARRSLDKEIDHLDDHCRDFIAHVPFLVLATTGDGKVDVSPRGGPPGFVAVLDAHHLAVPDMAGNNRLDSMRNIVDGDAVAALFMVPGTDETLRVNGRARITTDPVVLDRCPVAELRPNVAIVIDVRTAFIQCAKALRRGALWDPDRWPDTSDMAAPACMLKDHIGLEGTAEESQRFLDAAYEATTWKVGGND